MRVIVQYCFHVLFILNLLCVVQQLFDCVLLEEHKALMVSVNTIFG